eukprot:9190073-Heterocapsa_arctica.AAC.1
MTAASRCVGNVLPWGRCRQVDGVRIDEQAHLPCISLSFEDSHQLTSFLRSTRHLVHEASQKHAIFAGLQRDVELSAERAA